MIDIHTHILYGLDDGARSLEESITMCQMAYRDGVRMMVATPHTLNGVYRNDRSTILNKVEELNEALLEFGIQNSEFGGENTQSAIRNPQSAISFRVLPGADVSFSSDIVRLFEGEEVGTLNDKGCYIMVEFPSQGIPYRAEEVLFQLMARGVIPIISHPERNLEIARKPERYYEMIQRGCLGQVTAMSLTGGFGSGIRRVAEKLLASRLIHVIASDAHSVDGRPPVLSTAVRAAGKILGAEEAWKMVTEYPQAVLEGRRPSIPDPISP